MSTLPPEFAEAIAGVWSDPIIPSILERSNEFYLMDSAAYFFAEAARICRRDYVPNTDDVLRARAQTTGITETRFTMGPLFIQCVVVHFCFSDFRSYFSFFGSPYRSSFFKSLPLVSGGGDVLNFQLI